MKKSIKFYLINFVSTLIVSSLLGIGLMGMLSITLAQNSPWTRKANMPTARLGLATAVVDGKIYAIGGYPRADGLGMTTNEVYDPVTDSWEKKAPMPTGRRWLAASAVNGKIYVFGGYYLVNEPGLSTVEEYDPSTDMWTTKTPMPTARLGPASCVVDGIIYVIGGASLVSQQLKTVEAYDPETDTWTKKADLPFARMMLNVNAVNSKIYAIGGRYGSLQMYTLIEEYDPATDTWTEKFDMPINKGGYATTVMNAKIYIIGGVNIESGVWNIYPLVEEYDPIANTWARRADMPKQRWALGANTVDGKIYAIGGAATDISNGHPGVKVVEEYDPVYDLTTLIDQMNLNKTYAEPGNDSVCISIKFNNPAGVTLFAEIEAPDKSPINSLQIFDDGNHNDGNAGDGLFANVWPVISMEEHPYYVDLQVTKTDTDTIVQRINNMALFTTVGPLVFEELTFGSSDNEPNPGDEVTFKITLKNNGSIASATDVKVKLSSLDTLVTVINNNRSFKDIEAGNSKTSLLFKVKISENCSDSTEIKFAMDITSNDYPFWTDTCSVLVIEPTTSINLNENTPRQFILDQNFPNPFNPKTVIGYSLPVCCDVELSVYNILGQKVVTLVNKQQTAGSYELDFDASNLSSGTYFYKLLAGEFEETRKMLLLK